MSATPVVSAGPYRTALRRRTSAEKRHIRQRRVSRIVFLRLRSLIVYTAYWVVVAVVGSFAMGVSTTTLEREELNRQAQLAALYAKLFDTQTTNFNSVYRMLKHCQDRETLRWKRDFDATPRGRAP